MKERTKKPAIYLLYFLIMLCIAALIGISVCLTFNDTDYTVTITDKDRVTFKTDGEVYSKYLVFGDLDNGDNIVFENTDSLVRLKFNSSDMQGRLKIGQRYKITVIGVRVPFYSRYQNIIKVKEINKYE